MLGRSFRGSRLGRSWRGGRSSSCGDGWAFPVGYDLTPDEMRQLGLFVSDPGSPEETDRPFSDPGLFVLNPPGQLQIVDISNAPFARPDLELCSRASSSSSRTTTRSGGA